MRTVTYLIITREGECKTTTSYKEAHAEGVKLLRTDLVPVKEEPISPREVIRKRREAGLRV